MWFPLKPGSLGFTGFTRLREKGKQGHVLKEMKRTDREKDMSCVLSCSDIGEPNRLPAWFLCCPSILNFPSGQRLRVSRNYFHTDKLYEQGSAVQLPPFETDSISNKHWITFLIASIMLLSEREQCLDATKTRTTTADYTIDALKPFSDMESVILLASSIC